MQATENNQAFLSREAHLCYLIRLNEEKTKRLFMGYIEKIPNMTYRDIWAYCNGGLSE